MELDWTCIAWGANFRPSKEGWVYRNFVGTKWNQIRKAEKLKYLLNAYRVLLTRARQGMIIFVPNGDDSDATRSPKFYDSTYDYLVELGIPSAQDL